MTDAGSASVARSAKSINSVCVQTQPGRGISGAAQVRANAYIVDFDQRVSCQIADGINSRAWPDMSLNTSIVLMSRGFSVTDVASCRCPSE